MTSRLNIRKKTARYAALCCALILILLFWASSGMAQPEVTPPVQTDPPATVPAAPEVSLEATIKAETEHVARLEKQLSKLKAWDTTLPEEMNAYKLRLSNSGNLLVSSDARIEEVEKAWAGSKSALEDISRRLEELREEQSEISQSLEQADELYSLNNSQLLEMNTHVSNMADVQTLIDNLETLLKQLAAKMGHLEEIQEIYAKNIHEMEDIQGAFTDLTGKFDQRIQAKKKEQLFKRKEGPLFLSNLGQVEEELSGLLAQFRLLLSDVFWTKTLLAIWNSEGVLLLSSLLLFGIIQILLFQARGYLRRLEEKYPPSEYPWRHLILQLLNRSIFLLGATLFLYSYAQIRHLHETVPFVRAAFHILLVWLFSRWMLDFLALWNQGEKYRLPPALLSRLRILTILIRVFAIPYVILAWLIHSESMLLLFGRGLFEMILVIWGILFWQILQRHETPLVSKGAQSPPLPKLILFGIGIIIIGGGIVLEVAGYGTLALYWYTSWGCTAVSLLWGWLSFCLLYEWHKRFEATLISVSNENKPTDPIRWLLLRISWLAWIGGISVAILFSWGAKRALVVSFFKILGKKLTVGGMELSFMGFVYAFLILLCTHAATRVWRHTILNKLLAGSGLGTGIRNSIATITVYLFWTFGILISLNIVGISATSLTVVFGALGIGLGFGLQNIFNNFISGVILLFERPIQVGDVVEINGTWGEVRQINVRSTWVQTYNNASLIIPNADFISSQVTNWSFKDRRLRRTINIGVAYGSDTELVSKTLLEIAENTPLVFKYPRPYTLFTDFGDSALMFQLRFWSDVDNCVTAESEVRFEIDRLFQERQIEIPFPQRDIHMRDEG